MHGRPCQRMEVDQVTSGSTSSHEDDSRIRVSAPKNWTIALYLLVFGLCLRQSSGAEYELLIPWCGIRGD